MSVNEWKGKSQTDAIMELLKKVNKEIFILYNTWKWLQKQRDQSFTNDGCTDGQGIFINISGNSLKRVFFSVLTGMRIYELLGAYLCLNNVRTTC